MTQKEAVLDLLQRHGTVTLGQFFNEGLGYTARNRISELRREGHGIVFNKGPKPSENSYTLKQSENGQMVMAL